MGTMGLGPHGCWDLFFLFFFAFGQFQGARPSGMIRTELSWSYNEGVLNDCMCVNLNLGGWVGGDTVGSTQNLGKLDVSQNTAPHSVLYC